MRLRPLHQDVAAKYLHHYMRIALGVALRSDVWASIGGPWIYGLRPYGVRLRPVLMIHPVGLVVVTNFHRPVGFGSTQGSTLAAAPAPRFIGLVATPATKIRMKQNARGATTNHGNADEELFFAADVCAAGCLAAAGSTITPPHFGQEGSVSGAVIEQRRHVFTANRLLTYTGWAADAGLYAVA